MAKAYSDDLRRRILQAYEQGEGSEARLAQRFRVSVSYVKKIRRRLRQTGKRERVPHHPGRKPKFTPPVREQAPGRETDRNARWAERLFSGKSSALASRLFPSIFTRVGAAIPALGD